MYDVGVVLIGLVCFVIVDFVRDLVNDIMIFVSWYYICIGIFVFYIL